MSEEEILEGIRVLAPHDRYYHHLYEWLQGARRANIKGYSEFMDTLLAKEPKDIVDVVLILEG